jgi:hypothetical protein
MNDFQISLARAKAWNEVDKARRRQIKLAVARKNVDVFEKMEKIERTGQTLPEYRAQFGRMMTVVVWHLLEKSTQEWFVRYTRGSRVGISAAVRRLIDE